jgi:syntaxin of plants SYP6
MLDELDDDIQGTMTRLQAAQKRMNHVMQKMGMRGQLLLIIFLIFLLVVLIVIAFSP